MSAAPTSGAARPARRPAVVALARAVVEAARWRVALALVLTLAVGLASGATAFALVPLLEAVGLDAGSGGRQVSHWFAAALALIGQRPSVGWALVALVGATALKTIGARYERVMEEAVELTVLRAWRLRLFAELSRTEWQFYCQYRTSDLVEVLVEQVDRAGVAARTLLGLASGVAVGGGYLVVALRMSAPVTALAAALVLGLVLLLGTSRRRTRALGMRQVEAGKDLYAVLVESLGSMKAIRAYNAEALYHRRLERAVDQGHDVYRDLAESDSATRQVFDVGSVAVLGAVAYVALVMRGMPPAELFVLLFVFSRVAPQMAGLHSQYQRLLAEAPAFGRLRDLAAELRRHADAPAGAVRRLAFERSARLSGVTFGYGGGPAVVQGVSLAIPAGATVAIVGPSGAGKTTVADLVLGLLSPQTGRLEVDDVPITPDQIAAWREGLGYVPQDGVLFHDTIRGNLLWGAAGATDRDLQRALEGAAAWSFVTALPAGLDTVVGDRGVLLSGGERQRLVLARALVRQPQLLILDEATSSLDSENERLIERAIDELHGRIAILLITHRLSAVRRADVIYVLDRGQVVESGRWDDLLARRGRFHALCMAQGIPTSDLAVSVGAVTWPRAVSGGR